MAVEQYTPEVLAAFPEHAGTVPVNKIPTTFAYLSEAFTQTHVMDYKWKAEQHDVSIARFLACKTLPSTVWLS